MATKEEMTATFDTAHGEFVNLVSSLTPAQWRMQAVNHPEIRLGPDERRPVGVIAHHVAMSYRSLRHRCQAWMRGEEPGLPPSDVNERHAAANPQPDQGETLALLQAEAEEVRDFIAGLSEADLMAKGLWFRGQTTVAQMIGETVPFHIRWHGGSIRASLAEEGQPAGSS
jgi:hypothetical protein